MSNKQKGSKPDQFVVIEKDSKFGICHAATDTVLSKFLKSKDVVEEVTGILNELAQHQRNAWTRKIKNAKTPANLVEVLKEAVVLVHPVKNFTPQVLQPKAKSKATWTTGSRAEFSAESITPKEKLILCGIADCVKAGIAPTCANIAARIGTVTNSVSGAVSVLLAKGLVESARAKVDGKARRVQSLAPGVDPNKLEVLASRKSKTEVKPKTDKPAKTAPKPEVDLV